MFIEQESVFKLYNYVCNGEKLIRIELFFENCLLDFEYKEIRESIKNLDKLN